MKSFKQEWERELEQQRKDYFDRVGYHSSSSLPLPVSAPAPYTQAWPELSGMSAIVAQENYKRAVKAQQDVYSGKSHKRFMDAIDKLERFRG
jgi:hypothetical protein